MDEWTALDALLNTTVDLMHFKHDSWLNLLNKESHAIFGFQSFILVKGNVCARHFIPEG